MELVEHNEVVGRLGKWSFASYAGLDIMNETDDPVEHEQVQL